MDETKVSPRRRQASVSNRPTVARGSMAGGITSCHAAFRRGLRTPRDETKLMSAMSLPRRA